MPYIRKEDIMNSKIEMHSAGFAKDGKAIKVFKIPNSTDDYIEISTYGCALLGIHVHNREGIIQNILCETVTQKDKEAARAGAGLITMFLGPDASPVFLSEKLWEIAEIGANFVFLTCHVSALESSFCDISIGAKIMWVNLNRLVVDIYITPKAETQLNLATNLFFNLAVNAPLSSYHLRSFCPFVQGVEGCQPVENTPFSAQSFQVIPAERTTFISDSEEMQPLAELTNTLKLSQTP
jgi:hypothetical protein